MQSLAVFKNQFVSLLEYIWCWIICCRVLCEDIIAFLHFTLYSKKQNYDLIKQIRSIIIKNGDVLILVKITQVNLYGQLMPRVQVW